MNWVIGSGIAGLCLARELALSGREVTLCGPPVSSSASWAAGGLLQLCGGRLSSTHLQLRRDALAVYRRFVQGLRGYKESLQFVDAGHLRLAARTQELEGLKNFTRTLKSMGVAVRWMDSESLHQLEGQLSTTLLGACLMPDARVEVSSLLSALEDSVRELGVVRDQRSLRAMDLSGQLTLRFKDDDSVSSGQRIYLACGAQTDALLPGEVGCYSGLMTDGESCRFDAPAVNLVRSVALKSSPHTLLPGLERWCFSGGGATEAEHFLKAVLETPVEVGEVELRRGTRVQAPDGLPVAGPTKDPRVVLLTGLGRNGLLTAPFLAKLVVEGRLSELAPFSPQRSGIAHNRTRS